MRTIKVHGSASIMEKPDWMKICMNVISRDVNLQHATKVLNDSIDRCVSILQDMEVDKESLNIGSLSVQHYKDYDLDKPTFHASQTLTLEQTLNRDLIKKIMSELAGETAFNINVNYSLKDSKNYERQAMKLAIDNATQQANLICEHSKLKLGEIQSIEDVNTHVSLQSSLMKASSGLGHESVELEDVTINQSLTITWEIK